jgi:hypothetical protein
VPSDVIVKVAGWSRPVATGSATIVPVFGSGLDVAVLDAAGEDVAGDGVVTDGVDDDGVLVHPAAINASAHRTGRRRT